MRDVRLFLALLATGHLMSTPVKADDQPGVQRPARLDVDVSVQLDYLLYLPQEYDGKQAWPLVLFLHGAGERGSDLEQVKKHGPPRLIAEGKHFPFIVVSPQCPAGNRWEPMHLAVLLDDVIDHYKIDQDRIYVTGLSMGGYGTWSLAGYIPDRLAAIVPICGGGESRSARRIAHLPTWVFHGAKDRSVPLEQSQQMVDALKAAGAHPKFTIYPEAEHDSWTATYNNPELYEWLLAQERQPREGR